MALRNWGDVLSDIASQLGNMFLQAGFSALGKGLFPGLGFADGGYMPPNSTALVGERGPEFISTGSQPVNVTSNEQSQAAMSRLLPRQRNRLLKVALTTQPSTSNYNVRP